MRFAYTECLGGPAHGCSAARAASVSAGATSAGPTSSSSTPARWMTIRGRGPSTTSTWARRRPEAGWSGGHRAMRERQMWVAGASRASAWGSGNRPLQREPVTRAHERPGRPVLHDVEQSRQTSLLVPLAIDVLRNVGPVHHPVRRGALIPRRYSIERKLALVARDADAEGGRRVAAIDLAHLGIRIGAVAVIRDV